MKKLLVSLVLCLIIVAPALCETSMWVVKTDSTVTYLGGTIHILRQSDYPLPPEFDKAYQASKILVLETDIAKLQTLEFQQAVMAKGMFTDSTTLDKVLSADVYARLENYCVENGLPMANIAKLKPWMIMLTLLAVELQKMGVTEEGIDTYFYNKAGTDQKTFNGLETLEEQIDFMSSMGDGNENNFISYSLDDLDQIREKFDSLLTTWKTGDVKGLNEMFVKEAKEKFPKLYQSILVGRNNNWIPRLEEYLKTPETELVLVGVAHMVGEEGVIAQLRKLGYTVEKMK